MGPQRKMSNSFKRGSLKSSTSGSQKVSELFWAACGCRDRTEGLWSPTLQCGSAHRGLPTSADGGGGGGGVVPSEQRLPGPFSGDGPPFLSL